MVPLEPAVATVVATDIPVVAELVFLVFNVIQSGMLPAALLGADPGPVNEWKCPGSVTVDVAVCEWLTTMASALPPVLAGL